MINYIRHDEQFFGTVKLTSGEEVLGEILVSQDPDTQQDMIFIQNPARTKVIELDPDENAKSQKVAMAFMKWMNFSDEDFYVLDESSVTTIAPMSKEAVMLYKRWVRKEILEEENTDQEVPINKSMGLLSKVDEARSYLERIFNNGSHYH